MLKNLTKVRKRYEVIRQTPKTGMIFRVSNQGDREFESQSGQPKFLSLSFVLIFLAFIEGLLYIWGLLAIILIEKKSKMKEKKGQDSVGFELGTVGLENFVKIDTL